MPLPDLSRPHLLFASGARWFAAPADGVGEVVPLPALTPVPGAPEHLLGVFAHRGEVLAVADLGFLAEGTRTPPVRAVVLRTPRGAVALTVTRVDGVQPVTGTLEPAGEHGARAHFYGPAKAGERAVTVLEPDGLFEFLSQRG